MLALFMWAPLCGTHVSLGVYTPPPVFSCMLMAFMKVGQSLAQVRFPLLHKRRICVRSYLSAALEITSLLRVDDLVGRLLCFWADLVVRRILSLAPSFSQSTSASMGTASIAGFFYRLVLES